jgi:hypothetical protein
MRAALQFRAKLVPYLYTSARRAYDTGISIVSPMYYYWPQFREMFTFQTQYMLGELILVGWCALARVCWPGVCAGVACVLACEHAW